jgi:EAL domain-containing protein (putative c-di-GMP-specific phosphodiesterase class I)
METLRRLGITFSLDDFGTGYSSLAYLRKLPLDQLKIDYSFMRDVLTDSNDASIVRSIIALGDSLGLQVIAEGVETLGQREWLSQAGCFRYQGFLYERALSAEHFAHYASLH